MSHEIESMFLVGQGAWHGLGQVLKDAPTIEDGIKQAGLDWQVNLAPLMMADGRKVDANATIRSSDNSILGVVGPDYTPLQNIEAFKFFQPFLDSGLATLEAAGSLRQGKRVYVLAKIKNQGLDVLNGDKIESYVLLSNSHDGTLAVRVGFTPIRVVCANTLKMAHKDNASKLLRVKHSASVKDNLAEIQKIMNLATNEFSATIETYRKLANTEINSEDLKKYVKLVMGVPEKELDSVKGNRVLASVSELFEGRATGIELMGKTYWGAYNSFNEYLTKERGKDNDKRIDSLLFGQGSDLNQKALDVAIEMAAA